MKKTLLSVFAAIQLVAVSLAFAADKQPTTGYKSSQLIKSAKLSAGFFVDPTNIVIINFSEFFIHAIVPGTSVDQPINSGGTGIISHPSYYGSTRVAILNGYNRILFDQWFCRHAVLTVDGGPDIYRLNVNTNQCY